MSAKTPIRVLCVFSTLDRGGAETMCMNLYRHIDRSEVQFDFVKHTSKRGDFEDEIEQLGGRVYEAPRYKVFNQIMYETWWCRHLKTHPEHQIVHGHYFTISAVYFKVCKRLGRITIAHSHCTNPPEGMRSSSVEVLARMHLLHAINRYADVRLACSHRAGIDVFRDANFTVLNNAIDTELFRWNPIEATAIRSEFGLGNAFVVGNVSRFNLQKNPHGTLDIFLALLAKRPNSRLLWVGDGPMRREIEERVANAGARDSVVFTGVRGDVDRLYQAMDAFVFPSLYEGLGLVAVEAQNAGVPTLCSDSVQCEAGVTDLCSFLPLDNPDDWVAALCSLPSCAKHPDMAEVVADAGYDIHQTAQWVESLYVRLGGE